VDEGHSITTTQLSAEIDSRRVSRAACELVHRHVVECSIRQLLDTTLSVSTDSYKESDKLQENSPIPQLSCVTDTLLIITWLVKHKITYPLTCPNSARLQRSPFELVLPPRYGIDLFGTPDTRSWDWYLHGGCVFVAVLP
jgi:hypothetical protein